METQNNTNAKAIFDKAKASLAADMKARGIGAIIWDNRQANFHYNPVVDLGGEPVLIDGLYLYGGKVYLLEEEVSPLDIDRLYNPETEVKPVVVTLDSNDAERMIGDPATTKGITDGGTLEEWTAIADCYFEALNLAPEN